MGISGHQAECEQSIDELNCCNWGSVANSGEIVHPYDQQQGGHLTVSQGQGGEVELVSAAAVWE